MQGLGILLVFVGLTIAFLTYTKSTGPVLEAIFNAPRP